MFQKNYYMYIPTVKYDTANLRNIIFLVLIEVRDGISAVGGVQR